MLREAFGGEASVEAVMSSFKDCGGERQLATRIVLGLDSVMSGALDAEAPGVPAQAQM